MHTHSQHNKHHICSGGNYKNIDYSVLIIHCNSYNKKIQKLHVFTSVISFQSHV